MNPTGLVTFKWKAFGAILLLAALTTACLTYRAHVFQLGVKQERDRRDLIDAKNSLAAANELTQLNTKMRTTQAELDTASAALRKLEQVNRNEKIASAQRESALRAGTERLRADFVKRGATQAGSATGGPAAGMGDDTAVTEDLSPEVAGNLESLRNNENNAIDRLNACIKAYDAVKAASEK